MRNRYVWCLVLIGGLVVSACGGSSSDAGGGVDVAARTLDEEPRALEPAGDVERLAAYMRNGLLAQYFGAGSGGSDVDSGDVSDEADGFSRNNVQESGVAELDRYAYTGSTLFLAAPEYLNPDNTAHQLRILGRDDTDQLSELAHLDFADWANLRGLYQQDHRLWALGSSTTYDGGWFGVDVATTSTYYWGQDGDLSVRLYDVTHPEAPELEHDIRLDGHYIDSRMIDGALILVSAYSPNWDELVAQGDQELDMETAVSLADTFSLEDMLPHIVIDDTPYALNRADRCFIPNQPDVHAGYHHVVSVTRIDPAHPEQFDSVCLVSPSREIYASTDSLYVAASDAQTTSIHKIDLTQRPLQYVNSAVLPGQLGWSSNSQFRMSEHDGYFRVLLTEQGQDDGTVTPVHYLHILDNTMQRVSTLPNASQTTPIGKPNEDIYGVRFAGDRAYVVTFERIDPLYVLNLSDPQHPVVAGTLEIPGYSAYLHPISDSLLLGIGQQIDPDRFAWNAETPVTDSPIVEGMKVALFDVSEPTSPQLLDEYVMPDAYTPVEENHQTFTALATDEGVRVVLPWERWSLNNDSTTYGYEIGATTLTITSDDSPQIAVAGDVVVPDTFWGPWEDRSVLHGDRIYMIHANQVWHSDWRQPGLMDGPY